MSSWEYSPEQWYDTYILGKHQTSKELTFGSIVDKKLQEDPTFLPQVPRYPVLQHTMKTKLGKIPLIGVADSYDPTIPALADFKTGKKPWDQKRADSTGQLSFYALLLYLIDGIRPDDIELYIHWLPTKEDGDFTISFIDDKDVRSFKTRRTMLQVLEFGIDIKKTIKEMEQYVIHKSNLRQINDASKIEEEAN